MTDFVDAQGNSAFWVQNWWWIVASIWAVVGYIIHLWMIWRGFGPSDFEYGFAPTLWPLILFFTAILFPLWLMCKAISVPHNWLTRELERRGRERRMGGVANEHPTAQPIVNVHPTTRPHEHDSY